MLIRKINTVFMKHSRWLFGVFTIVIIISFLGFMVPGQFGMGGCANPGDAPIGQAYGENVSYNEAIEAMRGFLIVQELMTGRTYDAGNHDFGFYLVAQRKAAQRRGITASNKEITDLILSCGTFQKNGKFDLDTYNKIIQSLRQRGMDGDFIANAFREEIIRTKLGQEIQDAVIPTDGEAEMFYRFYNGEFSVATAAFRAADYLKQVKVDSKALQTWFAANRKKYTIPAQMTGLLVEVSYLNPELVKLGNQAATDAEVKKYFDANTDKFIGKDGKPQKFADAAKLAKTQLVALKIRNLAAAKAQQFAREVYDQVGEGMGKDDIFRKTAGKYGLKVTTTGKFGADAAFIGKVAEPELIKQMDQVLKSVPVTNAVVGKSAVYVGYVLTREEARPAEWKEVAAKATADYRNLEAVKLARAAADAAVVRLNKLPADKRAADKVWTKRSKLSLWSAMQMMPDQLPPMQILAVLPSLKVNDVTKALPDADGAVIGMVTGWKAPAMDGFKKDRTLWVSLWQRQKSSIQAAEFQRELESNCKLYQEPGK